MALNQLVACRQKAQRNGAAAGRKIEGSMAIVILGGLVTSTLLNLLVLPTLSLRFGEFDRTQPDVPPSANQAMGTE